MPDQPHTSRCCCFQSTAHHILHVRSSSHWQSVWYSQIVSCHMMVAWQHGVSNDLMQCYLLADLWVLRNEVTWTNLRMCCEGTKSPTGLQLWHSCQHGCHWQGDQKPHRESPSGQSHHQDCSQMNSQCVLSWPSYITWLKIQQEASRFFKPERCQDMHMVTSLTGKACHHICCCSGLVLCMLQYTLLSC